MIVISGALVLVALVLLVLGLTMQDLNFVYGSIAVSLVSFVFLVIGILQRRGEQPVAATAGPEVRDDSAAAPSQDPAPTEPVAVPVSRGSRRAPAPVVDEAPEEDDAYDDEELGAGGAVLVVPGRPRYHVGGCRYLTGRAAEEIDVLDARAEGFTACGVCKPDAALAEEPEDMFVDAYEPVEDDDVVDTGVPGVTEPEPAAASRTRGSRRVAEAAPAAPRSRTAPAKRAPAKKAAKKAPAKKATAAVVPVEPEPVAAPAKSTRRSGRVVVIPDRGRFHTHDCRFVRGVEGTEELTRTQATKQGYQACGVCKPA